MLIAKNAIKLFHVATLKKKVTNIRNAIIAKYTCVLIASFA